MCGRYCLTSPPATLRLLLGWAEAVDFPPRFNIAPTQPIAIVSRDPLRPSAAERHFRLVRWGLVPAFARDFGAATPFITARQESLAEVAAFRAPMMRRRCLVPADGWYAWRRPARGAPGTPYLLRRPDQAPLAFAGLWDGWSGGDGCEIDTACIVTVAASGLAAGVSPRMPACLPEQDWNAWLDGDTVRPEAAARLLRPWDDLEAIELGPAVNAARNDGPEVQQPVGRQAEPRFPQQFQLF